MNSGLPHFQTTIFCACVIRIPVFPPRGVLLKCSFSSLGDEQSRFGYSRGDVEFATDVEADRGDERVRVRGHAALGRSVSQTVETSTSQR